MYSILLMLHSVVRWVVLILGVLAVFAAVSGLLRKRDWTGSDRRPGSFFAMALDIQFLLGLILYFVSPLTRTAMGNLSAAMSTPDLRFIAVEHVILMLAAIVLAHVGNSAARRAPTSQGKFMRSAIFFGLALLLILLGIPWMRPLLPLG